MANEKNLIPNHKRTPSERRANAKKAGVASGQARREKKMLKECLEILLERKTEDESGRQITGAEAMAVKAFEAALKGDWKAWELVRDTAGQKPVEKVMVADIDQSVIDEVEAMVLADDDGE